MQDLFGISSKSKKCEVSLKRLSWTGKVDGLLFTYTARQEYRNTGDETTEVIYTFPLAWNSLLTEFAAVIDNERYVAQPMKRHEAEARYEEALEEGDLPLMLECSDAYLGLCTANLGSLRPGESVVLEMSFAQMLTWDRGTVRLNIPTVVGPRYSADGSQGGLREHERVETDALVSYEGDARIVVSGPMTKGRICSLNHAASYQSDEDRVIVEIKHATPDRDIAITSYDVPPQMSSFGETNRDGSGCSVAVCLLPEREKARSLNLKVLVDCSGSMGGIPISQARQALAALVEQLDERDRISLSRFGSDYVAEVAELHEVTNAFKRRDLLPVIARMDANLGGTEMDNALRRVFEIPGRSEEKGKQNVLLITDGDIYGVENVVKHAKESAHRIFVVAVSTAPASYSMHALAEATGGLATVAMPTEDMTDIMGSFVASMRSSGQETVVGGKSGGIPFYSGVSRPVFVEKPGELDRIGLLESTGTEEKDGEELVFSRTVTEVERPESSDFGLITKLMIQESIRNARGMEEARALSEKYGILSPWVNFLLVKERDPDEKTEGIPALERVPQMMPYQQGGLSGESVCYGQPLMSALGSELLSDVYDGDEDDEDIGEEGPLEFEMYDALGRFMRTLNISILTFRKQPSKLKKVIEALVDDELLQYADFSTSGMTPQQVKVVLLIGANQALTEAYDPDTDDGEPLSEFSLGELKKLYAVTDEMIGRVKNGCYMDFEQFCTWLYNEEDLDE